MTFFPWEHYRIGSTHTVVGTCSTQVIPVSRLLLHLDRTYGHHTNLGVLTLRPGHFIYEFDYSQLAPVHNDLMTRL